MDEQERETEERRWKKRAKPNAKAQSAFSSICSRKLSKIILSSALRGDEQYANKCHTTMRYIAHMIEIVMFLDKQSEQTHMTSDN